MVYQVTLALKRYIERTPNGSEIPGKTFKRRHIGIMLFTAAHLPFIFFISRAQGLNSTTGATLPAIPLADSLVGIGVVLGLLILAALPQIPRRLRSAIAACAFMTNASILAYYTGGFIEVHFLYFIGVGVVALYEDWVSFVIAIGYVGFHHSLFGLVDWFAVYNHPAAQANPVIWGSIHAFGLLTLATTITLLWQSLAIQREQAREKIQEKLDEVKEARKLAEQKQKEAAKEQERMAKLNKQLRATAEAYQSVMVECANGDFTRRLDDSVDNEAMAKIATTFNEMMDELEETIGTVRTFANKVSTASDEVTVGTEESQRASEQVSESIQAIAADAESQSENLQEASTEMQNLSGTVEEVAASTDEMAAKVQETAELGKSSQKAATGAMNEMEAINEKVGDTVEEAESLETEIKEIGEIVEFITDIADQTNILALNASIEAARAGEAGDGFAVVADEIKGLANEVSEATTEIESLIVEIQSSADTTVEDIQEMRDRISSGTTTIEDALSALESIAANAEESGQSVQEINTVTDDQAASTEEVASMISEVANTAEQVSGESGNVSAAAEEQTSSLTEVTQNTQTLADQAEELQELLSEFTIGEAAVESSAHTSKTKPTVSADGGADQ